MATGAPRRGPSRRRVGLAAVRPTATPPEDRRFDLAETDDLLTPALAILPAQVDANIAAALVCTGGPDRWRPHIKTTKSAWALERLLARGRAARQVRDGPRARPRGRGRRARRAAGLSAVAAVRPARAASSPSATARRGRACWSRRPSTSRRCPRASAPSSTSTSAWGAPACRSTTTRRSCALVDALAHRDVPFRGPARATTATSAAPLPSERRLPSTTPTTASAPSSTRCWPRGVGVEEVVTSGTGTFRDALAHAGLRRPPRAAHRRPGHAGLRRPDERRDARRRAGHAPAVAVLRASSAAATRAARRSTRARRRSRSTRASRTARSPAARGWSR